jgi:hypothetical protein
MPKYHFSQVHCRNLTEVIVVLLNVLVKKVTDSLLNSPKSKITVTLALSEMESLYL